MLMNPMSTPPQLVVFRGTETWDIFLKTWCQYNAVEWKTHRNYLINNIITIVKSLYYSIQLLFGLADL